ncbi:probable histone-lysine N-methyltransferase CG1716 isoform X2 [Teleopsis dalmanni]|uniref:probable histone-lysine N-methyltransferase CG1716 isoform X2 n=1 Tax=Teleopsis dalmanni TaxID=139649 RepID=UPI0018CDED98|nr:probable histone-lysine N-methyltransferase CG1716 isoform X2 [Teleopsis dalmanni]
MEVVPKKRLGRPPKATQIKCNPNVTDVTESATEITTTSLAVGASNTNISGSNECRRSSRQKKIKPDVLNFLKKIPKQHKIQIEARIDSNAPTQKGKDVAGLETNTEDQQNKNLNATQCISDISSLPAQARRLSRTQEFFNATMMKSKQNSSLIVTKMESIPSTTNNACTTNTNPNFVHVTANPTLNKQKQSGLSLNVHPHKQRTQSVTCTESTEPKRRGRPPKKKNEVSISDSTVPSKGSSPIISDLLIENAEDQKCLANQVKSLPSINISENKNNMYTNLNKNIKENKIDIEENQTNDDNQNISTTSFIKNIKKEEEYVKIDEDKTYQNEVLEILSSDDETNETSLSSIDNLCNKAPTQNESKQRNFAAVSFLQESPNLDDEINEPEFIVAAVEEIICESHPLEEDSVSVYNDKKFDEVVEIHSSFNSLENLSTEMVETQTVCKKTRRASIEISDNSSKSLLSYDSICEKDVSQSSTDISNNLSKQKSSKKRVSKYKRSTRSKSKQTKEDLDIDNNASADKIDCSELVIETYSQNQLIDVAAVEEIETSTCEENLIDKSLYHHTIEEFNTNVNANSTLQSSMNFENVISIDSLPTDNITISVMDPNTDQLIEVGQSDKEDDCEVVQYEQEKGPENQIDEKIKEKDQTGHSKIAEQKFENKKYITLPLKKQKMKLQDIDSIENSKFIYTVSAENSEPQKSKMNIEDNSLVYTEIKKKVNDDDSQCEKDNVYIVEVQKSESETFGSTPNTKNSEQETDAQHVIQTFIPETSVQTTNPNKIENSSDSTEIANIYETLELSEINKDTTDILIANQIEIEAVKDVIEKPHEAIECTDNNTLIIEKQKKFDKTVKEVICTNLEKINIPEENINKTELHQRDQVTEVTDEQTVSKINEKKIENIIEIFVKGSEVPNPSEDNILSDKNSTLKKVEQQDNALFVQTAFIESSTCSLNSEKFSIENTFSSDNLTNSDLLSEIVEKTTVNTQKNVQIEENLKIVEVTKLNRSKNKLSSSRSKSRRFTTTKLSIDDEQMSTTPSQSLAGTVKESNNATVGTTSTSNDNEDRTDNEVVSITPLQDNKDDNKEKNIATIKSDDNNETTIISIISLDNDENNIKPINCNDNDVRTISPLGSNHNEKVSSKITRKTIEKTCSPVSLEEEDLETIAKVQSCEKLKDQNTKSELGAETQVLQYEKNPSTNNKQSTETIIPKGRRGRKAKNKSVLPESHSQSDLGSTCDLSALETDSKNINIKTKNNEPASESSESTDSLQKSAKNSNKKKTAKPSTKNVNSNKIEKKHQYSQEQTKNEVDESFSTRTNNIADSSESSSSIDIKNPKTAKSVSPRIKSTIGNVGNNKDDMPSRSSPVSTEKKNKTKASKTSSNKEKISKIKSDVSETSTVDDIELNKSVKSKGRRKKFIEELALVANKNVNTAPVEDSIKHNAIEDKRNDVKSLGHSNSTSQNVSTLSQSTKKDCTEDEISDPFKNIAEFIEMGVSLLKKKPSETFEEDDNYRIVTIDDHHQPEKNNVTRSSTDIDLDENKKNIQGDSNESSSIRSETKSKEDDIAPSLQAENQLLEIETNTVTTKETQTATNEQSIFTGHEYSIEGEISANIANYPLIQDSIPSVESTNINDDLPFSLNLHAFETPADTPIVTPSTSPPPETSISDLTPEELLGVRRSHRIKQITKAPKSLVGRGLVRDKERLSMKDYVEVKSRYSIEDHRNSLADVTEVNAKFLKSMEQRLSNFTVIEENEYKCERVISREARKMQCDCFLTPEDIERGEWACGEDCLNRLLMIECGPDCNVGERCTNKRFQKILSAPCRVFRTEKKGFGIMADVEILPGEFILEYVGEVIDGEEFDRRRDLYSLDKNRHYYFMALRSDTIIDATIKGNISRFINHSCDPNAETQKWTVNGEVRVGFFSRKSIMPGEEITFDYQYERYGREAQRCFCEAPTCRGWIGQEPTSDEGEQTYGTDDESSESETESIEDPMEAQKKLEMAAVTANLLPIIDDSKGKLYNKLKDTEEAKLKLKNLLNKVKRNKQQQQKKQRKNRSTKVDNISPVKARSLEDPDIEDEVNFLRNCGLKNQPDTLRLSRLMVRAKLVQTRLDLLKILTIGELPCRRLFLDYHGLRLLHGWMSENGSNMTMRLALLETLESLPIVNKTPLTDSKVLQTVRNWSNMTSISSTNSQSPNDESSSSSGNSQQAPVDQVPKELQKLAEKLTTSWENLPEIFRIPKRERIEQMKVHEREADLQYANEAQSSNSNRDRYQNDRFGKRFAKPSGFKEVRHISTLGSGQQIEPRKRIHFDTNNQIGNSENTKHLSKKERREMFEAKMARSAEVKRLNDFETKCKFFGLDPKVTIANEMPFCVNPHTGQWYNVKQEPIYTPPNFLAVQPLPKSTNLDDYELPPATLNLKPGWKVAVSNQGKIYYYNVKTRKSQWTPPTDFDYYIQNMCSDSSECTSDSDGAEKNDELLNKTPEQLKMLILQRTEERRKERLKTLVGQREISPRRDEDRIYNQAEMRKYKENKEKIRKRKEEIRRKRATKSSSDALPSTSQKSDSTEVGAIKIQDYLLSSDEEENIKAECNNSPLLDKIVQGDKIVDELDALKTKRILKRPLPPHRDLSLQKSSNSQSSHDDSRQDIKKRKVEKKTKKYRYNSDEPKYRKLRDKFRNEIVNIIAQHLKPYYSESCKQGRICNSEDYMHLARKLTHFVMIKEIKYCESVGQVLAVTDSVINKSREFIKKYMSKYGETYIRREDDPEFKDIKISTSV